MLTDAAGISNQAATSDRVLLVGMDRIRHRTMATGIGIAGAQVYERG